MNKYELCQRYIAALNNSDLKGVLALFSRKATVASPLYGVLSAEEFYARLLFDTMRSDIRILNIFDRSKCSKAVALHFEYNWTFKNGTITQFECVDIFNIDNDGEKFRSLMIIYDTAQLRKEFLEFKIG
ncbi:hypothetical protein [Xanthomonas axonopodis]